jgi:hypothetical protein
MATVLIRQIPDDYSDSTGLGKYNRSRMPGCKDVFQVALNVDGRYVTGIDEDGYSVKTEEREKIKSLRESLEKRIGKELKGNSIFWEEFRITIDADKPKLFNTDNPLDLIALKALIANRYVAPDKDSIGNPDYRDAQYYSYTEESEAVEEITTRKKRDRALSQLLGISDNKEKMLLYGQFLEGIKYNDKLGDSTLYKMLRAYIEDKEIKNSINFLEVINKPIEELQQKIIVDKALKQKLISRVGIGNKKHVYQFGQITLGATIEEVYKNLSLPDFAPELLSIKNELDNK